MKATLMTNHYYKDRRDQKSPLQRPVCRGPTLIKTTLMRNHPDMTYIIIAETALTINNQFNLVLHSAILHAFSFITIANIVVVVLIIVPVVLIRLWHGLCFSHYR